MRSFRVDAPTDVDGELAGLGRLGPALTWLAAAQGAWAAGAASVDVAVTHALFVGDALLHVRAANVRHVWSSDSVPHASNVVGVAPLLAQALRGL